jgi:CHAT domain
MPDDVLQGTTPLPPIQSQDYPVDVYIRLYRREAQYDIEIQAVGQTLRVPINVSPDDLGTINEQLQSTMEAIARDNAGEDELTDEELATDLRELAEAGNYAFKKAFSNATAMEAIRNISALPQRLSIQIASEDFSLPWELIYPVELDTELSYEHFWGMKYIISRLIVQYDRPGAFVSPTISFSSQPKFGLLTYNGLPSVEKKEIPYFEKLADDGKITLFKLRALEPDRRHEEFGELKVFWSNALDVAHLACHAFYRNKEPNLSNILLSNEFPITLKDMDVYGLKINGYPLVILNACETGNLNSLYTSSFARAFLQYGARGVVAAECIVPDVFAADFAEQLYSHILTGEYLGESLLATRRYFLKEHQNPSGLLYSMYAPPSIRLTKL